MSEMDTVSAIQIAWELSFVVGVVTLTILPAIGAVYLMECIIGPGNSDPNSERQAYGFITLWLLGSFFGIWPLYFLFGAVLAASSGYHVFTLQRK